MATKDEKALRRKLSATKRKLAETVEATRKFLGQAEDRYEIVWYWGRVWKELARQYRVKLIAAHARVHALNLLVRRLSNESVLPEEAAELRRQIAALIAEVGTLRSRLREWPIAAPSGRSWWEVRCATGRYCWLPGAYGYTWEGLPDQPYDNPDDALEAAKALDSVEYSCGRPAECGPHSVVRFVEKIDG